MSGNSVILSVAKYILEGSDAQPTIKFKKVLKLIIIPV